MLVGQADEKLIDNPLIKRLKIARPCRILESVIYSSVYCWGGSKGDVLGASSQTDGRKIGCRVWQRLPIQTALTG